MQQALEGRLKTQCDLNLILKENCEVLEQLAFSSQAKATDLQQQLVQLNLDKEAEKRKLAETVAMLKKLQQSSEMKIFSLKEPLPIHLPKSDSD